MVEEHDKLINLVALGGSIIGTVLEQVKYDGKSQALLLAALFETFKTTDVLNPSVDMAVSFNGLVIRNENAADHSQ